MLTTCARIENQFFISATENGGVVTNLIAKALVDRIVRAAREGKRFKVSGSLSVGDES